MRQYGERAHDCAEAGAGETGAARTAIRAGGGGPAQDPKRAGSDCRARAPGRAAGCRRIALTLSLALALGALGCRSFVATLPANVRGAQLAEQFAEAFWSSDDDALLERMTSFRLKTIMRTGQMRALRAGLVRDYGPVQRLGQVWYEDSVVDIRRFRVPVEFARTTVDMRIQVDESRRISGFFMVDHIAPPL